MIWLVSTGWQGNGAEGVLVEADSETAARTAALEALTADINAQLDGIKPNRLREDLVARAANYTAHRDDWEVEKIDFPYIAEFS
jgi:hypothetical protein